MSKKKSYDRTFKEQAIQLALTSKQSIAKTAKELGVLESTLYYWALYGTKLISWIVCIEA